MVTIVVEDISSIKKKLTFEVPSDQVKDKIDAEYRDLKKTVQVKGFRRGKVPLAILKSYFKKQVEADTARKIMEETFEPGLEERAIKPVSVVSLDPEMIEEGQPFKFTAEVEVSPPIVVTGHKELHLKKTIRTPSEEEVSQRLDQLRERNARLSPVPDERGTELGDHLVVDVVAEEDGTTIPSLTVTDYHMELGRNFYLPDFDEKLLGMKVGESRNLTEALPDSFPNKELRGKSVSFGLTLKEAKQRTLPDLDDDFAKDLGKYETLEALTAEIREDVQRMIEAQTRREVQNQILDQLLERNEFDVPDAMVEGQLDIHLQESLHSLAARGIDLSRVPMPTQEHRNQIKPEAVRTVKAGLMLRAIAEQEALSVSDEEVRAGIEKQAALFEISTDYFRERLEQNDRLEEFRQQLLEEKVYHFIEEHAEITEEQPEATEPASPSEA